VPSSFRILRELLPTASKTPQPVVLVPQLSRKIPELKFVPRRRSPRSLATSSDENSRRSEAWTDGWRVPKSGSFAARGTATLSIVGLVARRARDRRQLLRLDDRNCPFACRPALTRERTRGPHSHLDDGTCLSAAVTLKNWEIGSGWLLAAPGPWLAERSTSPPTTPSDARLVSTARAARFPPRLVGKRYRTCRSSHRCHGTASNAHAIDEFLDLP